MELSRYWSGCNAADPIKWSGKGNTAKIKVISAMHENSPDKNEDVNLWAFIGYSHGGTTQENNNDGQEQPELDNSNQQDLPEAIKNAAGMTYICSVDGCSKTFSKYRNFVQHMELEQHEKK